MAYFNAHTQQYPVSEADIRAQFPNVSFQTPFVPPIDQIVSVAASPQPEFNPVTQMVKEIMPGLSPKSSFQYEQRWEVVSKFREYTDENDVVHTVAEQEAAAIALDASTKADILRKSIVDQTSQRLDAFAATRNYGSILSLCSYVGDPNPKFAAEGQYGVEARSATWSTLYTILDEIVAGTRPMPTGFADIEPLLPVLEWPASP